MSKIAKKPIVVDGVLKEWGEAYDWRAGDGKSKKRKQPGGSGQGARKGAGLTPRQTLQHIAQKTPQAIVKFTGGGKGAKGISAHLTYISRHGQLALEDQDGQRLGGKGSAKDVVETWTYGPSGLPHEGRFREAFNIVLSSPQGTDPQSLLQAARDFAQEEFGGRHDYVMALHEPKTDPSKTKSENPHVHLVVKVRANDGKRLNPRKADLHGYRQSYARHLRNNGIAAIAVKRQALFNAQKGEKQSIYQIKKRGEKTRNSATELTQAKALARALENEARAKEIYADVVSALSASQASADKRLAKDLKAALPGLAAQAQVSVKPGPTRGRGV